MALCAVAAGVRRGGPPHRRVHHRPQQFGRPIATFQAVASGRPTPMHAQAVRLTMLQAAWRLSAGMPAAREVAVAKYWAAAGGQRGGARRPHLHGGVMTDHPLHRYFLLAKQLSCRSAAPAASWRGSVDAGRRRRRAPIPARWTGCGSSSSAGIGPALSAAMVLADLGADVVRSIGRRRRPDGPHGRPQAAAPPWLSTSSAPRAPRSCCVPRPVPTP